jgi:hypothetical protein
MTLWTISSERRAFCCLDFPGQSLMMTCGIDSCLDSLAVLLVADVLHPVDAVISGAAVVILAIWVLMSGQGRAQRARPD